MNVVFVVTDDQERGSIEHMPYVGSTFLAESVYFPNSVQSTPWCGPVRANLLTGQRTDRNGVIDNATTSLIDKEKLIFVPVQATGAKTGLVGKYENHHNSIADLPAGLDRFWAIHTGDGESFYFEGYNVTDYTSPGPATETTPGTYATDEITAQAVAFINAHAASPFFLYVAYTGPHYPSTPAARHAAATFDLPDPPDWNTRITNGPSWMAALSLMDATQETATRADRLEHYRSLLSIDEGVEDIVAALTANNILDDTIVVFCTDNGNSRGRKGLGENYRYKGKTVPMRYAATGLLMIRHPQATARTDMRLVNFLDLPRMILSVFDATPVLQMDGDDLLPVVLDEPCRWRTAIDSRYISDFEGQIDIPKWKAIRWGRWSYADWYEEGEETLFDLNADPHETANVAASNPEVVALMRNMVTVSDADPRWNTRHRQPAASLGGVNRRLRVMAQ